MSNRAAKVGRPLMDHNMGTLTKVGPPSVVKGHLLASAGTLVEGLSSVEMAELKQLNKTHKERVKNAKRMAFKKLSPEERQLIVNHNRVMSATRDINCLRTPRSQRHEDLQSKEPRGSNSSISVNDENESVINSFSCRDLEVIHSEAVLEEIIDGEH